MAEAEREGIRREMVGEARLNVECSEPRSERGEDVKHEIDEVMKNGTEECAKESADSSVGCFDVDEQEVDAESGEASEGQVGKRSSSRRRRSWWESELERMVRELAQTERERIQAAEYGLAVLEEKHVLQHNYEELEHSCEAMRNEVDMLKEAFGQACSNQRQVAAVGESREESLLLESANKEAGMRSRITLLECELHQTQSSLSSSRAEVERLSALSQQLGEKMCLLEMQRNLLRDEVKEYKHRESHLLQDCSELEEENIALQKNVSVLRQNQVEYESLKHEIKRLEEDTEDFQSQLDDALLLKQIGEQQLEEALEMLGTERDQKNALRRELLTCPTVPGDPCGQQPLQAELNGEGIEENVNDCHQPHAGSILKSDRESRQPAPSLVSDLLSELSFTEIQKLQLQLSQVEKEKAMLLENLQDSQKELEHTKGALTDQQKCINKLMEQTKERCLSYVKHNSESSFDGQKAEGLVKSSDEVSNGSTGIVQNGSRADYFEAQLTAAVSELVQLQAEVENARQRGSAFEEKYKKEKSLHESELLNFNGMLMGLQQENGACNEHIVQLEKKIKELGTMATENQETLTFVQEELTNFSEELANLYHHVCLCNSETPSRVMLDHYKETILPLAQNGERGMEGKPEQDGEGNTVDLISHSSASEMPDGILSPITEVRREPMSVQSLWAVIRDQMSHLQQAVERAVERSRQQATRSYELTGLDKDKEVLVEEVLKLKSLLITKREQIATFRAVLKANKMTAESAMFKLKGKYQSEKSLVTETMLKLRNELKGLKEDAVSFSTLRSLFATRCDDYMSQLDSMQRQLSAAEDEKRTLNSLLRMAIQQKLALTQRLEDLAMQEQNGCQQGQGRTRNGVGNNPGSRERGCSSLTPGMRLTAGASFSANDHRLPPQYVARVAGLSLSPDNGDIHLSHTFGKRPSDPAD
uniref:protein bicaudal D homolog 2-like n=1 Tax=Myxine glutinosa TaxID=7769 RepID=UPI00358F6C50